VRQERDREIHSAKFRIAWYKMYIKKEMEYSRKTIAVEIGGLFILSNLFRRIIYEMNIFVRDGAPWCSVSIK